MFALIFEKGMVTLSWYAWLALRRRVSMSAIGSVVVMGIRQPFSPGFPDLRAYGEAVKQISLQSAEGRRRGVRWVTRKPSPRRGAHRGEPCPGRTPGRGRTCGRPNAAV